jgi:hypothetical protein
MIRIHVITTACSSILAIALGSYATPVAAQATRTWVSGVGDDLNPCSRTAPCKTFAGAISKTATGGEINCLDPGAYGAVTIGKALSIICQYTEAGVLATLGSSGITVNAPAGSAVYLSGLDLFGAGTGLNGIRFIAGASLTVENSIIRGFGAASGAGISFKPSGSSVLNVNNVTIGDNGNAGGGSGILIQPTGAAGTARVALNEVRIQSNAGVGIRVDTTGNTAAGGIILSVTNTELSGNPTGMSLTTPVGTTNATAMVSNTRTFNNIGAGLSVNGAGSLIRVDNSVITANGQTLSITGGTIRSYGNNFTDGNGVSVAFTAPNLPPS